MRYRLKIDFGQGIHRTMTTDSNRLALNYILITREETRSGVLPLKYAVCGLSDDSDRYFLGTGM